MFSMENTRQLQCGQPQTIRLIVCGSGHQNYRKRMKWKGINGGPGRTRTLEIKDTHKFN